METIWLSLDPTPGLWREGASDTTRARAMLTSYLERSRAILGTLWTRDVELAFTASVNPRGLCSNTCPSPEILKREPMYLALLDVHPHPRVSEDRQEVGTDANGEYEVWGHNHKIVITAQATWPNLEQRWGAIIRIAAAHLTGEPIGDTWTISVTASIGMSVEWLVVSPVLKISATRSVILHLQATYPDWLHGTNWRVGCRLVGAANHLNDDGVGGEALERARLVLTSEGWTDLRLSEAATSGHDLDLFFIGTAPANGSNTLSYRDPPYPY